MVLATAEKLCQILLAAGANPLPPGESPLDDARGVPATEDAVPRPLSSSVPSQNPSSSPPPSSWPVYVLSALTAVCYAAMCTILFATESSKPLYTLDTDMTWTFDNVQSRLDANLGIHGAKQHLRLNLVDHMFPFLYAPLLALLHVRRGNSRVFVMLSLLAGILDLVENRVIRGLLLSYIEGSWAVLQTRASFTV